jgi:hypothetical protein
MKKKQHKMNFFLQNQDQILIHSAIKKIEK